MYSVLMVEDDPELRRVNGNLLKESGMKVISTSSRASGWRQYMHHRSKIDLVVLDWRLDESDPSNKDGVLLAKDIRRQDPNIPMICVSAYHKPNEMSELRVFDQVYEKGGSRTKRFIENIEKVKSLIEGKKQQTNQLIADKLQHMETDRSDVHVTVTIENLTLEVHDLVAITSGWPATNSRRGQLIEKMVGNSISQEEMAELDHLQILAGAKRQLAMPLPIRKLEAIEASLKKEKLWPKW